jgi:hypothetical protein
MRPRRVPPLLSRRERVEVELELLKLVVVPAIMQLSCDSRVSPQGQIR